MFPQSTQHLVQLPRWELILTELEHQTTLQGSLMFHSDSVHGEKTRRLRVLGGEREFGLIFQALCGGGIHFPTVISNQTPLCIFLLTPLRTPRRLPLPPGPPPPHTPGHGPLGSLETFYKPIDKTAQLRT